MKTSKLIAALAALTVAAGTAAFAQVQGEHYKMSETHRVPAIQDTETPAQRDARMAWWREARFGMFIHWGLYSIPAGTWNGKQIPGIGEWIMNTASIPVADYKALAKQFNPTAYSAHDIVALAKSAGMKYIVITSKHHDGFAMFDSKADPFNIVDATPYHRDPIRELAEECRKQGIKLGFYYSQDQDWTAPGGAAYKTGNHDRPNHHWDPAQDGNFADYLHKKAIPQLKELLTNYGDFPAVIWFDTPTADMTPELAGEIVALLNQHPNLIWNNRLGGGYKGDTETPEQFIPARGYPGRDWEACMTINDTWGYKSYDLNFKSTQTLLRNLIDISSKGGNYLLNIGPEPDGSIPPESVAVLEAVGKWLDTNGKAIYGADRGSFSWNTNANYTRRGNTLYIHQHFWPGHTPAADWLSFYQPQSVIAIGGLKPRALSARLLKTGQKVEFTQNEFSLRLTGLPLVAPDQPATVIEVECDGEPVIDHEAKRPLWPRYNVGIS